MASSSASRDGRAVGRRGALSDIVAGSRVRVLPSTCAGWWVGLEGHVEGFRKRFPECAFVRFDDDRTMEILVDDLERIVAILDEPKDPHHD
jgi:hypothetical protein